MTWWDAGVGGLILGGALCGAGIACAVHAVTLVLRQRNGRAPMPWLGPLRTRRLWIRLACAVGSGTVVGLMTGWPVGALLAVAAGWWAPALFSQETSSRAEAELAEALASWVEQLRDMLTGASGLHQAVTATVPVAPERLRDQVRALDARLRAGQSMEQAAPAFARETDSDLADLVAVTLITGASRQAGDLAGMLGRLAEAARDRATTVERISASRAKTASSVRIIAVATGLMVLGMAVVNPGFLAPLGTLTGQVVLGLVGGVWAASFFWLARLASPPRQARPFTLAPGTTGTVGAS